MIASFWTMEPPSSGLLVWMYFGLKLLHDRPHLHTKGPVQVISNKCTWRNFEQNKEDSQTNSSAKNAEGLLPFLCEMFKIKTSAIFAKWNSWSHLNKGNKRRWFLKELVTRIVEKSCPGGRSFSLNTWERAKSGHFGWYLKKEIKLDGICTHLLMKDISNWQTFWIIGEYKSKDDLTKVVRLQISWTLATQLAGNESDEW